MIPPFRRASLGDYRLRQRATASLRMPVMVPVKNSAPCDRCEIAQTHRVFAHNDTRIRPIVPTIELALLLLNLGELAGILMIRVAPDNGEAITPDQYYHSGRQIPIRHQRPQRGAPKAAGLVPFPIDRPRSPVRKPAPLRAAGDGTDDVAALRRQTVSGRERPWRIDRSKRCLPG
ncbi:MAG: hypothetical protein OJF52_002573 [Nitrospira sp.]|nr:MAG: hypothetical protein OJF52_002573 [Nitrospira sp.]